MTTTPHINQTVTEPTNIPMVPQDTAAEAAVIGSVFLNRDAIDEVGPWLEPSFFYHVTNRAIYQAMHDLWIKTPRQPSDFQTVGGLMEDRGELHLVGDRLALTDYVNAVPTSYHVEYYAERVYNKAIRRMTIEAGRDISDRGYRADDDKLFDEINTIVKRVADTRKQGTLKHAEHAVNLWYEQLESGGVRSIPTGLAALDRMLGGGFHPGEMIVLAARPGVGKSWAALKIMHHVTKNNGRVLYITYEMSTEDLVSRLIAIETGVNLGRVRQASLMNHKELGATNDAAGRLVEMPFVIADDFGATMDMIESQTRMEQGKHGDFALVIIDYLQLINTPKGHRRDTNRQNDVSEFSRGVKRLAGTLGCPVLAMSQLNRAVEGRAVRVPMLSDLRESGSIEQDADVVAFIDREEVYNPQTNRKGIADIHIAKQRNGPLGRVSFHFDASTGHWKDTEGYQNVEGY